MISVMFSIHDKKAEAFLPPFFARARGEAIRMFMSAVDDPQSQFRKFPGDYALYIIGEFDDLNGEFKPNKDGPERIFSGLDVNIEKS